MPEKFQSKLRYSTKFTLNPAASTNVVQHVFSANGLYDPDITGVGHQPRGFDQLMSLYAQYTVTKCQMRAFFDHIESSGAYGFIYGIFEDVLSSTVSDSEDVMEKPHIVSYLHSRDTTRNSATYTCYPTRRLGYNNPGNTTGTQLGTASQNPGQQVYLKPFIFYPNTTAWIVTGKHV